MSKTKGCFRFLLQKRYRAGQGTNVSVYARCVHNQTETPKATVCFRFPPQKRYQAGQGTNGLAKTPCAHNQIGIPKATVCFRFLPQNVTGRVREPTYRYTPGASPIKRRSRGFSWLCWDDAASEWPCSQSGESVPGSRRKSDPLLPGCECVRRTYQSASAARLPLAR